LTAFGVIDFGNTSFNHAVQIQDTLFIYLFVYLFIYLFIYFIMGIGMQTLENQAFIDIERLSHAEKCQTTMSG